MSLKHTPGNWTVIGCDENMVECETQEGACWKVLMVIGRPWTDSKKQKAEARANAYLVSAAPDMLHYLKNKIELSLALFKDECKTVCRDYDFEYWKSLNEPVISLIEKATGMHIEEVLNEN